MSILALVSAHGAVRAEEDKRPTGRAAQKGDGPPGKNAAPAVPPPATGAGKAGPPKQQYNPKEVGLDK
ncbi:MAG: hypothetical protein JO055_05065 [Alphaproteobacteria bacterium]|nr:hypothetical protein [Alphaproteobacteria bacterium]